MDDQRAGRWGTLMRAVADYKPGDGGGRYVVSVEDVLGLREVIIEVLCSQALSDHMGDIRTAERHLWELLGVTNWSEVMNQHVEDWNNGVFQGVREVLAVNGLPLPAHLREGDGE